MPALCDSEDDWLGREIGEALCPERFNEEELLALQKGREQMFAGLYQQLPTPPEGSIIKRDWMRYYMEQPSSFASSSGCRSCCACRRTSERVTRTLSLDFALSVTQ